MTVYSLNENNQVLVFVNADNRKAFAKTGDSRYLYETVEVFVENGNLIIVPEAFDDAKEIFVEYLSKVTPEMTPKEIEGLRKEALEYYNILWGVQGFLLRLQQQKEKEAEQKAEQEQKPPKKVKKQQPPVVVTKKEVKEIGLAEAHDSAVKHINTRTAEAKMSSYQEAIQLLNDHFNWEVSKVQS